MRFDLMGKKEGGFVKSRLPQRVISDADSDFLDELAKLKELPDRVFWKECFNRSKLTRGYTEEKILRLGKLASDCGEEYADKYRDELQGRSITELCRAKGIIINEFAMPQSPTMELFGLFEAPNTISIRADLLRDCNNYLKSSGIGDIIGNINCGDIVLAHEFFHFVECKNEESIITCTYTEPHGLLGTGRVVPALGEIAAMSFARRLLLLDWNPFILDCVMMSMNNLPAARAIAGRLLHFDNEA